MTAGGRARTAMAAANAADRSTIGQVLDGHVTLEVECLDGSTSTPMCRCCRWAGRSWASDRAFGNPVPSPALQ